MINKGIYIKTTCCNNCDWAFLSPNYCNLPFPIDFFKMEVCPKCGSDISEKTGRFIFTVTEEKYFFGLCKKEKVKCIGFERK